MKPEYLNDDGSLNMEYFNKISVGKFMEIAPKLTKEQMDEYRSKIPKSYGPIKPIVIDREFEEGMEEENLSYYRDREPELATRIATMYLKSHPRPEYYLVRLGSTVEDSEGGYYKELSEPEKELFVRWEDKRTGVSLDEFIKSENKGLYDRLVSNKSLYALDMIQSCDLNSMRKYSKCQIREYRKDIDDYHAYNESFPLSDEEFSMLLSERISRFRGFTMNSLVVHHPELAQRIMRHLICLTGMMSENAEPFMVIFTEIENAFDDIIKHQDALDIRLRNYLGFRGILG